MKELKLPLVRLYELTTVVDSLQPKDLGDLKSIRLAAGIVNDLKASLKEFADKNDVLVQQQQQVLKGYQERYQAASELTEEEKKGLALQLDKDFQAEVNTTFGEAIKELSDQGQAETTIELSDEKFAKLQELFEKNTDKYLKNNILLQVADALGV